MFKGIIKQMANASATEGLTVTEIPEVSADVVFDLREAYAADIAAREQLETLKNAKALKGALEQYGTTPEGYRAVMAFADANGELSAAFDVSNATALESLDADVQLAECGKIVAGLESFITAVESGEDTASVEGLREVLARGKRGITALSGVAVAAAALISGRNPLVVGGGVALASAGVLYVADKIANKGRVDGSYQQVKDALDHAVFAAGILKKLVSLVPEDPSKAADAIEKLVALKGDFAKIGVELDTDAGRIKLKADKGFKAPKMTMVPFSESGWTAENVKAIASEYGKQALSVRAISDALMAKYTKAGNEAGGLSSIPGGIGDFYSAVDVPAGEADWALFEVGRSLKSVAKFFTAKKEEPAEAPAEAKKED